MTTATAVIITVTSCACAAIITALLMMGAALGGNANKRLNQWFFVALLCNTIGACFEGLSALLIGRPGGTVAGIYKISDLCSYAFGSLVATAFALYVYEYLSIKKRVTKAPFTFMILCSCINIVLVAIGQITESFMLLDASNNYDPQGLTLLAQILPTLMLITLIAVILQNFKLTKVKEWGSFLVYAIMPMACYIVESFFMDYPLWITYFGVAVVLLLVYVNIQVELKNTLIKKEAELTESRVAVMLSQIQPHFLYNSLSAIENLCIEDPMQARDTVHQFSKYLRGNLDSLTKNQLIPFKQELSHVRNYMSIEQTRFREKLKVEYEIEATGFSLPALTVQPIMENAVRNGVNLKKKGGTVILRTAETKDCFLIFVIDDGVGFDPDTINNSEGNHVGIVNVQERLSAMCGGSLHIDSTPGEGTAVTITIPKEARTLEYYSC